MFLRPLDRRSTYSYPALSRFLGFDNNKMPRPPHTLHITYVYSFSKARKKRSSNPYSSQAAKRTAHITTDPSPGLLHCPIQKCVEKSLKVFLKYLRFKPVQRPQIRNDLTSMLDSFTPPRHECPILWTILLRGVMHIR